MHPPIILPLLGLQAHTAIMLYIILALGLFSYLISRRLEIVPDNIQSVAELLVEGIKGLVEETMGHHGRKYFPLIATFGIYILISNLLGFNTGFPSAHIKSEYYRRSCHNCIFRYAYNRHKRARHQILKAFYRAD